MRAFPTPTCLAYAGVSSTSARVENTLSLPAFHLNYYELEQRCGLMAFSSDPDYYRIICVAGLAW